MDIYAIIASWHHKMGIEAPDRPTFFNYPAQLQVDLIQEEFDEFMEALANRDMVEFADALGDLAWVVFGAAWRAGVDIRPVMAEIARSNFTKDGSKNGDGKIMKGPNYSPPDIEGVLEEMGWEK